MSEPGTGGAPRALIAAHGELAEGLVSAVAQITGRGDEFVAVSNRGLSAADVEATIRELVGRHPIEVIFTDLPAGSCAMAARRLQRERPEMLVVTGTNLATLLDFLFPAAAAARPAAEHAVEKGKAAITLTGDARGA